MSERPLTLPQLYDERAAVQLLNQHGYPCKTIDLRTARQAGEISYILRGKKGFLYTEADLAGFIEKRRVAACPNDSKLENIGSAREKAAIAGTAHGMTPEQDRLAAEASMNRILNRRKSNSPSGTDKTTDRSRQSRGRSS